MSEDMGIFKKGRFRGIERGTFIKDMDKDMSIGDLENGGGGVSGEGEMVEVEVAVSHCREASLESVSEKVVIVVVVIEPAGCWIMAD
jgi:hypothetical protein